MTMISSYYASVGIALDAAALKRVDTYLSQVEKSLNSFKTRMERTSRMEVKLSPKIDTANIEKQVNAALMRAGRNAKINLKISTQGLSDQVRTALNNRQVRVGAMMDAASLAFLRTQISQKLEDLRIRITKATVDKKAIEAQLLNVRLSPVVAPSSITRMKSDIRRGLESSTIVLRNFRVTAKGVIDAINSALQNYQARGGIRLSTAIAHSSLVYMRMQMQQFLSNTVLTPRINPRISYGAQPPGRGGRGSGNQNYQTHGRYQNEGGGLRGSYMPGWVGSIQRFGAFAIPGVAGAMGLNAVNNFAGEISSQQMALSMVTGLSSTGRTAESYNSYLDNLAMSTGRRTTDLTPFFTQMLAASQGKEIETQLEDSFTGIVQYASVMGINDERLKRALVGFQQMIGKNQVMS